MARTWLPSPDGALVALADRVAGLPQGRGVPLPAAIGPLALLPPAGMLWMAAALGAFGMNGCAAMIGAFGLAEAVRGSADARTRLRDAAAWSPAMARRYRAEALRARECWGPFRMAFVALLATAACVLAILAARGVQPALLAAGAGYLAWTFGHVAWAYGSCAMPTDPDLRSPVPSPSAA